jgi:ABC-type bacteriocin/lantibiotic exporter with double-glycine peptidase domain
MVLDYLGVHREYNWLARVLQTKTIGTPFHNLANLHSTLGVHVLMAVDGSLFDFDTVLDSGLPIILAVDSNVGNIWPYYENHAVVIVGFNKETVFINNPAVQEAPQEVTLKNFLWAWSRRDYQYAIISLTERV